jgi:hypothetical protein
MFGATVRHASRIVGARDATLEKPQRETPDQLIAGREFVN